MKQIPGRLAGSALLSFNSLSKKLPWHMPFLLPDEIVSVVGCDDLFHLCGKLSGAKWSDSHFIGSLLFLKWTSCCLFGAHHRKVSLRHTSK